MGFEDSLVELALLTLCECRDPTQVFELDVELTSMGLI